MTEEVNTTTGEVTETPAEAVTKEAAQDMEGVPQEAVAESAPVNNAAQSDDDFLAELGVKLG